MALNEKSSFSLGDRIPPKKDTHKQDDVSVDIHTDNDTHTHEYKYTPKPRERKKFRAQILTYASLIEAMDEYAAQHDKSRAEVFEQAVSEFLERNT